MVRELLGEMLTEHFTLLVGCNGAEAMRLYDTHAAQLCGVITDWRMPEKNGSAVVAHIRRHNVEIPILVMSGDLDEREAERLQAQGKVGILRKPFSSSELLATIVGW